MQVNKGVSDLARLESIQKTSPLAPGASGTTGDTSSVSRRNDQVQFSDAGLALSSDVTTDGTSASELDPARVDELRAKVLSGAYNSLSVIDQVASAILRSGDL